MQNTWEAADVVGAEMWDEDLTQKIPSPNIAAHSDGNMYGYLFVCLMKQEWHVGTLHFANSHNWFDNNTDDSYCIGLPWTFIRPYIIG